MIYCTDTWFLLKSFLEEEKAKRIISELKTEKTILIVPTIVYAETMKKLMQQGVDKRVIQKFFTGLNSSEKVEVVLLDQKIAEESSTLSYSFSLSLVDAIIAATCKITGCDALLSGDTDYNVLVKKKYLKVTGW